MFLVEIPIAHTATKMDLRIPQMSERCFPVRSVPAPSYILSKVSSSRYRLVNIQTITSKPPVFRMRFAQSKQQQKGGDSANLINGNDQLLGSMKARTSCRPCLGGVV